MQKKFNLQLAYLRKKKGITQQTLAEVLGTSYQNISKWENGITMPDLTTLLVLSEYFGVTTDQLLGLTSIQEDGYLEEKTDTDEFWNEKLPYLIRQQKISWNEDYFEFLIKNVWGIKEPVDVLDLGCGYGYIGLSLLQYLPEGSTYTGVDFSANLLQYGEKLFREKQLSAAFIQADILSYQSSKRYDITMCQGVLRHQGTSEPILKKMMELTKKNGLIVSMDINREIELDGIYIEGMNYQKLCNRNGSRKHWLAEYENGDRDYAAAMRSAHRMHQLGIRNIEVRLNDKVSFFSPDQADYEENINNMMEFNSLWYKEPEQDVIERLMNHGMTRIEALAYYQRGQEINDFLKDNPKTTVTWLRGKLITFGRK
ncbi:MAG: methyltransferase domain-containing protein [Lachnospiraceae bacterium]|nr:methyltransferase domain-containing protein [Lachnospiraceae bacterium]